MGVDDEVSTLIFDFDGTLFDLPVDFAAVRAELRLDPADKLGHALQRFIDTGDQASLAVVTRHEVAAVAHGSWRPGAPECLKAGRNVAILTRNSGDAVRAALGELGAGVVVIGREDVRRLKPDPEGVRAVLTRFGVAPADAVLVGDTFHDVRAAKAAGVRSVVVRNPALEYAPEGADEYLDELTCILSGPFGA